MNLGERVKSMRSEKGLSLNKLAKKSGVSPAFLSQIENGISNPAFTIVVKLARAMGVSVIDFIDIGSYTSIKDFRNKVTEERARQTHIWGEQKHDNSMWYLILSEEIGEVAKAILEGKNGELESELVQVVAVIETWMAYLYSVKEG